ncbi:MAG: acyl--CoA ligase [bacterium]|nr:acyl--CoA ligase [bacterium]
MSESVANWDSAIADVTGPGGQFEIVESEIRGVPVKVFKNTPTSLRDAFQVARSRSDEIFLVYEEERITFGQVMKAIDELAAGLVENFEVKRGDRVAIAMRNYPEWIIAFAAITSVGGIAVCLNAWWTAEEMAYGLEDSGSKVLVADQERLQRAEAALEKFGVQAIGVRTSGDLPSGVTRYEDAVVKGASLPEVKIEPDDDVTILYTSGTTGFPKGAVSSQFAVMSALSAFSCRAMTNLTISPPKEKHPYPTSFILCVPLFHVTGLIPVMLSCFLGGFKLVIMYKWDPERALEHIEDERITTFVGVPTMSWDLLESPEFESRDTSSLLSVGGGGAPAPPELVNRIDRGFAKGRPGMGYGMTETNAYGPQNSGDDIIRKPRSAGRTVPVMQVKVADPAGQEVARGEVGEIMFKGPNLIRGYWNKPEATAETFIDGWLRSGDIGRMDEEGFVYVEDRAKDMVIRAGENIYCAEVEAAIYDYPGIYEAAVFGVPHERLGEELAVAIVLKKGVALDPEDLRTHLAQHIASFKIPSIVEIKKEQLPRNASGKILKRTLRDDWVSRQSA